VRKPKWISKDIRTKIKTKNNAYRTSRITKHGDKRDYKQFCKLRNQVRWETRKARGSYKATLAKEAKTNPKAIFKYVNSRLKTQGSIPDLDTQEGTATDDLEKAEALNQFFTSVFTQENPIVPTLDNERIINPITEVMFSPEIVKKKLEDLKPNKSPGPDGLHPRVLKELAPVLCNPLSDLMQKSMNAGELPTSWKDANITALHKKGAKNVPNNYRPVSLTSQICKIMESIIRDNVLQHLSHYSIVSSSQHGFTPGRSCSTQLVECFEDWLEAIDDGHSVDIIYLDFQKAFDSVPHQRLLMKMEALGISGNLLKWCSDFLHKRRQRVVLNGNSQNGQTYYQEYRKAVCWAPLCLSFL
jgi:hypothetical protein